MSLNQPILHFYQKYKTLQEKVQARISIQSLIILLEFENIILYTIHENDKLIFKILMIMNEFKQSIVSTKSKKQKTKKKKITKKNSIGINVFSYENKEKHPIYVSKNIVKKNILTYY